MENQFPDTPPPTDPLAIASIGCAVGGVAIYCCGSFMCVGWLAFPVWLIGTVLGIVGAAKGAGQNRMLGIVGIVLNVLPGILFGILLVFFGGLSVLNAIAQQH